jgi:hypothetical protein
LITKYQYHLKEFGMIGKNAYKYEPKKSIQTL